MTQLPPLNGLRAFEAAGRRLTFRAAAEDLGVTQGAVAQQVRQLEAHLGLLLFERLPKGLALTPSGRSYHAHIATAFDDMRRATDSLKPEPGDVRISVTPTFAAKWLIPNLPGFSALHPDIDLQILATERVSSFHSDGIDLAIRQAPPPFGAALYAIRLFRHEIMAVAAPALIENHSVPLDRDAIAHLPKLHDAHDLWPAFLKRLNVRDQSGHGLRLSQTTLAVDAALSGQGIALVSHFLVARDISAGHLVQVIPDIMPGQHDFHLLVERKSRRNPAIEAVIAWLTSEAQPAT
ncbi:LysR substrate-binding domain-containing protein [Sedimentitalea todarodis]|uniref:LysR substrate-binding domain-containing protein n=1 Tax=Sedimentitalea todarodis TaxID=1631240 RepID=A0ABU3VBC5_9RHOB|nr:LysR substrate-binding domain-containing protein [Sedimentitalea todarodis]MDU9003487.1 LysR substrate-binding domain-containing protein [Sedimentitalea todarodis]